MRSIAIDGPAGAGKSTLARKIAGEMGFIYVDTGALYRTVALYLLREGVDAAEAAKVEEALERIQVDIRFEGGTQQVYLNGERVSDRIRTPEVSMTASVSSALPCVRRFLLDQQRQMARTHDVVMDGRDIGTVVLPEADVKIFLTASPEDRARRRYEEFIEKGREIAFQEVLRDMKQRDAQDESRAVAPLKPAEDALLVDTTGETLAQSAARMIGLIQERMV
ncbi:MAG: (d)CMP kinase [Clostridiales bacterium]|nr:(d)CMP kinase [Clostridiales bacterium]